MLKNSENGDMEAIISLCKRRGFIFQGSEIYGGLAGTWDYGPLGVALKNNIKKLWWKRFVDDRDDMFGLDAAILMNQNVWKASGHVGGFADPLVECKSCKSKYRVDHLATIDQDKLEAICDEHIVKLYDLLELIERDHGEVTLLGNRIDLLKSAAADSKYTFSDSGKALVSSLLDDLRKNAKDKLESAQTKIFFSQFIINEIRNSRKFLGLITQVYLNRFERCPMCGKHDWEIPQQFNMMFETHVGAIQDASSVSYLRPETAQGMFVNFKNILDSMHPKLPFGMGQIGKAFRNEIAPRDFIFRVREFEQMEIEYFVNPKDWEDTFRNFVAEIHAFNKDIGIDATKVHELEVPESDRAFYSKRTIDFEFDFPFGKKELFGLAYRTDYDLRQHSEFSKVDLSYYDEETKERFIPHCIEPSFGLDRAVLAVLSGAYTEDKMGDEVRTFLKLVPSVAPYKVAVFPLLRNKPELVKKATEIFKMIKNEIPASTFDDNGNIGKRYRRQDEIGTPYCLTVDFDTIEKGTGVTVRDRDSGKQERIEESKLVEFLKEKLGN